MGDAPSTLPGPSWLRAARAGDAPLALALVIAWSADEPHRVGEVALLPDEGGDRVLGRGASVAFARQRPGLLEETGPPAGGGVSREHLRLRTAGDAIDVERVGRGEMLVNGRVAARAEVRPGDTIALRHTLVLHVLRRPVGPLPPLRYFPPALMPAFGAADSLGLVGESEAAWRLRDDIAFAAGAGAHALILGESGSGKELVAGAIHGLSPRRARPLVARNAATLPDGLIDAELFGNAKDYPNPGMRDRPGLVGEADGSSLFLDEIGELPAELQAHLLRLLDGGEYHRLGESKGRRADVRLLAATNRDPSQLKHDLAARLALRVVVPGLGERREDVPLLARHLVRRMAQEGPQLARFLDGDQPRIHPDVIEHLLRRAYTTHVRELQAFLWRTVQASEGNHLALPADAAPADIVPPAAAPVSLPRELAEIERLRILGALDKCGGNQTRTAEILGMPRRTLIKRMIEYGIPRPRRS